MERETIFNQKHSACVYLSSLACSTAYGINEKRVLAVLMIRNLIAMNELIVVEIEDENFGRANLR